MKVGDMRSMIVKGWDMTRVTKTFTTNFQLVALEANIVTPFSTMTQGIEEQIEDNLYANPTLTMSTIMEECLWPNSILEKLSIASVSKTQFKMWHLARTKKNYVKKVKIFTQVIASCQKPCWFQMTPSNDVYGYASLQYMCNFVSFFQLVIFLNTTNVHKHLTKPYLKTLFFNFMKNKAQFHKCSNTNLYNSVKKPFDCLLASILASIQLLSKYYTTCTLEAKKIV